MQTIQQQSICAGKRWAAKASLVVAVVAAAGCASNPYISNPRPGARAIGAVAVPPIGTMDHAILYLDNAFDAWAEKLPEEFLRQQALSAGLITMGAVMIGTAASRQHAHRVLPQALIAATAYQLGTWNSSRNRNFIYLEGMKALSCAKTVIAPLRRQPGDVARLQSHARDLWNILATASDALGEATRALALTGTIESALQRSAEAEIAAIAPTLEKATGALGNAAALETRVATAGAYLEGKVDDIRTAIDNALEQTVSDLSVLPKVIAGMSDHVNAFAPGLDIGKAMQGAVAGINAKLEPKVTIQADTTGLAARVATPTEALAAALGKLRAEHVKLAARVAALDRAIDPAALQFDAEKLKQELKRCGVDAVAVLKPLSLSDSAIAFEAGKAQQTEVTVSGGTLPYRAQFESFPARGLNVKAIGNVVLVAATAEAGAGSTHRVKVEDSTGRNAVFLTVKVNAKPAAAAATGAGTGSGKCTGYADWSPADICLLQQTVGTPVDADFGSRTCAAVKDAWARLGYATTFDGVVNEDTRLKVRRLAGLDASSEAAALLAKLTKPHENCKKPAKRAAAPATTPPIAAPAPAAQSTACVEVPESDRARCGVKGVRCTFECDMTPEKVIALRKRLAKRTKDLSVTTPEFDAALRDAIADFQRARGLKVQNGNYTQETAVAVQDL